MCGLKWNRGFCEEDWSGRRSGMETRVMDGTTT